MIFAANHQSHLDTPVILDALPPPLALPGRAGHGQGVLQGALLSRRSSAARRTLTNSLNYYLASLFFNAFPLPQRETGHAADAALHRDLLSAGFSVLIFPEGRRTDAGDIGRFQPGVGMAAARLRVPVVPVRLDGLDRILHHTWKFPKRGTGQGGVRTAPMLARGDGLCGLGRAQVEEAVPWPIMMSLRMSEFMWHNL